MEIIYTQQNVYKSTNIRSQWTTQGSTVLCVVIRWVFVDHAEGLASTVSSLSEEVTYLFDLLCQSVDHGGRACTEEIAHSETVILLILAASFRDC